MGARRVTDASLPIVAAQWRRSEREIVRVTLDHDVIDVRCFFLGDEHEAPRPGRVGIAADSAFARRGRRGGKGSQRGKKAATSGGKT
jgi:hypothetical protein